MKKFLLFVIFGLIFSPVSYGAEFGSLDMQVRMPLHIQYVDMCKCESGNYGIAAWNIFGDVTNKTNRTATLTIIGPLYQYSKGSWLEVMGGLIRNENGYKDTVMDMRLLHRGLPKVNLIAEVAYFPKEARRRLFTWAALDTPVLLGKYQPRVGFESENIFPKGRKNSLGIGPRITFPIPMGNVLPVSTSLTVTYQFRSDVDFVRCYLGLMYVTKKK